MRIDQKLKYYRKLFNLTQDDVGEACSVDRSTVANWEAGKRKPNYQYLKVLSILFNVDLDVLDDDNLSPIKLDSYKFIKHNINKYKLKLENDDFLCINNYLEISSSFANYATYVKYEKAKHSQYNPIKHKVFKHSISVSIYKMVISIAMIISLLVLIPFNILKKDFSESFIPENIEKVVLTTKTNELVNNYEFKKTFKNHLIILNYKLNLNNERIKNIFVLENIKISASDTDIDENWFENTKCFLSLVYYHEGFRNSLYSSDLKMIKNTDNFILTDGEYDQPYINAPGIYDFIFYTSNNSYYIGAFLHKF